MPTPTNSRPCQAKDPSTCPYHGAYIKLNQAITQLASDPTNQEVLKEIFIQQDAIAKIEKEGLSEQTLLRRLKKEETEEKDYSFEPETLHRKLLIREASTERLLEDMKNKEYILVEGIGRVSLAEYYTYPDDEDNIYNTQENHVAIIRAGGRHFKFTGSYSSWDTGTIWDHGLTEVEYNTQVRFDKEIKDTWVPVNNDDNNF